MSEETEVKDSQEEQDEQQGEELNEQDEKQTVPLAKLMAERKKRQEAERKQTEAERLLAESRAAKERTETENKYVQDGVAPEMAKLFAAQDEKMAKIEDADRDNQIEKLATNDFFSDAAAYKDDIRKRMKDYGIDAETAYMMIRGPLRAKEVSEKQAQLALYNKDEAEEKDIEPGPAGTAKIKTYPKMTDSDKRVLSELRKNDPAWTQEKYYKLMYSEQE